MNAEQKYTDARRRLMESEASVLQALAFARATITQLEEENRELRAQVTKTRVELFTEEEFAKLCKVSTSTIARARKAGKIEPLMIGSLVRYSSLDHLAQVGEIFSARRKARKSG